VDTGAVLAGSAARVLSTVAIVALLLVITAKDYRMVVWAAVGGLRFFSGRLHEDRRHKSPY
jgi:hypothetical protein